MYDTYEGVSKKGEGVLLRILRNRDPGGHEVDDSKVSMEGNTADNTVKVRVEARSRAGHTPSVSAVKRRTSPNIIAAVPDLLSIKTVSSRESIGAQATVGQHSGSAMVVLRAAITKCCTPS